jgi:hypothetical protein
MFLVRPVEIEILRPLRAARRALSGNSVTLDKQPRREVLERVRAAELAAERVLLEALESLSAEPARHESDLADALLSLIESWSRCASDRRSCDLAIELAQCLSNSTV